MWEGKGERLVGAEKDWVFVSDAHFTGRDPGEMALFLQFLDSQKEGMGHLVILGDLFEFLFGFKSSDRSNKRFSPDPFPFPEYLPVFEALQRLAHRGIRITYVEGNHDFSLYSFFQDWFKIEVRVYPDGWEERLGGRRSFVAHGDLSNPDQWKYRFYRRLMKNRWSYRLIRLVGPRWSRRAASGMNRQSHRIYHNREPREMAMAFRYFARQKFLEGFEIVILGHSHFPERVEEKIEGRSCLYLNVGDWVTHHSYLRFAPPDRFELSPWLGSGL